MQVELFEYYLLGLKYPFKFLIFFVTWKEQQLLRDIPPNTNVNLA